mgnify:CR=1 FL=1
MKSFILALTMAMSVMPVLAEHETKKVCVDVKDKAGQPVKDAKGNVKQSCKDVKVHKKLDGTEVPGKK